MSIFDFDEFDNQFDNESLKKDVSDVENNKFERKEVPCDVYEVKVQKLELTKSSKGDPMVTCWFKIVAGEYKNQMIFMNRVINVTNTKARGVQLHNCNEFLRSLSKLPVTFESFKQYSMLLMDIMEEINGKYEYQLNYSKDKNGYSAFKIEKVFEVTPF